MWRWQSSEQRLPRQLPPISLEGDGSTTSGEVSPRHRSQSSGVRVVTGSRGVWSQYHKGCVAGAGIVQNTAPRRIKTKPCYLKQIKSPTVPSVSYKGDDGAPCLATDVDEGSLVEFLDNHQDFLDAYVQNHISLGHIEEWMSKKLSYNHSKRPAENSERELSKHFDTSSTRSRTRLTDLLASTQSTENDSEQEEYVLMLELVKTLCETVRGVSHVVYKIADDDPAAVSRLHREKHNGAVRSVAADDDQVKMIREVVGDGRSVRLSRDMPGGPPTGDSAPNTEHVMYLPMPRADGDPCYVLELRRAVIAFSAREQRSTEEWVAWGALALHYRAAQRADRRQGNMAHFLLDVVKAIFEEMVSLDQVIKRILEFVQHLVNADRASLFLVDYRNFELVSTVFDLKFESGATGDLERKEIRMPINRGIAGHVALSGETMNIPDAYSDYRFNREVDEATGYKTISILCMPIKVQKKVIGVVQMVNKRNDDSCFRHKDEEAFEIFSTFFGLALHHARLYDRIMRKEQKYRVALEVLSYHNTCRENEVQAVLGDGDKFNIQLNDFSLDPYQLNEFYKCKGAVAMFDDLFDLTRFDVTTVTRFILTVKKNYRTVPYHNFDHGWAVAHTMYVIFKNDLRKRFSYKERLAMFVACLCHDLDHRGYTNKYMSETASPLAAMYSTSTLEHHHFNITVTILQQEGHNIFSHMTSEEYKDILGNIRHCILATDLAAFFPNLAKMKVLYECDSTNRFSWSNNAHRELAMAVSMTAADLSASAKPWHIQIKTVRVIFEEFYDQGDKERAAGRIPIPMMDRKIPNERPASQVGFLSQICIPCYEMLFRILPNTKPMYAMALKNLHNWKSKAVKVILKNKQGDEEDEDMEPEEYDPSGDMIPDTIEEEEDVIDDKEGDGDVSVRSENDSELGAIVSEVFRDVLEKLEVRSATEPWEEEVTAASEDKVGGKLRRDIEGVTWIDEEGVVMRPNRMLTNIDKPSCARNQ